LQEVVGKSAVIAGSLRKFYGGSVEVWWISAGSLVVFRSIYIAREAFVFNAVMFYHLNSVLARRQEDLLGPTTHPRSVKKRYTRS
jgi:hypothetical protein